MVKCVVLGYPNRSDNNKGAFPNRPIRFLHFPKDQTRIEVCLAPVPLNTPFVLQDLSLALLTKKFLRLLCGIHHGFIDLNLAAKNLITSKPRVYDLTNCLEGTNLIQKQSRELQNLKTVEESLDELIKTCAQQLFDMTDNISGAPKKTKLELPTPKEIHLKGGRGPIKVLTCELGGPQCDTQGSRKTRLSSFGGEIMLLHTGINIDVLV
uniref:E2F/DP family winged-helix DNA-binding domain-containing protein n=1 Tax=Oncorhynchus mykiss TaxID=8022 RepID=A0A8C7TSH3_ONCMY